MKFHSVMLALCLSTIMTGSLCAFQKEIVLTRSYDGVSYTFDLRDLEAYIKKEYGCSLDIRVGGLEVLNARGPVLVIHDPKLVDGFLSCRISHDAWDYLQREGARRFYRALSTIKEDYVTTGMMASLSAGAWLLYHSGWVTRPLPLIGIAAFSTLSTLLSLAFPSSAEKRLSEGTHTERAVGFTKVGEHRDNYYPYEVQVKTCFLIQDIPSVTAKKGIDTADDVPNQRNNHQSQWHGSNGKFGGPKW